MSTATRYHVNPSNGESAQCHARSRPCPFGGTSGTENHYGSLAEAQSAAETMLEEKYARADRKRAIYAAIAGVDIEERDAYWDSQPQRDEDNDGRVHYQGIPAEALEKAQSNVDKANKKLERNGVEDRFTMEAGEPYMVEEKTSAGVIEYKQKIDISINKPVISRDGYTFLATLTKEDSGFITRVHREQELAGWKPDSMTCDHCGQNRARNKTFIVTNREGEMSQIGSSCVKPYLGVSVSEAGLWALEGDPLEKMDFQGISSRAPIHYDKRELLAISLAVSNDGDNYVSTSSYEGVPTSSLVHTVMNPPVNQRKEDREWVEDMRAKANEYMKPGNKRIDEVLDSVKKLDSYSDYGSNMKTLSSGEHVSGRSVNMMVSAVAVESRERRKAAREAAKPAGPTFTPGHFGTVGEKFKDQTVKVVGVRQSTMQGFGYNSGTINRSILTMQDSDGHQLTWFASKVVDVQEGQDITLSSGNVKKHDNYKGTDQTILGNVRVKKETKK